MATTPSLDVDNISDDHVDRGVEALPRSADLLGCHMCGLPAQEHGRSVIHRFARPELPTGYRYLDEVGVGDELALRRRPAEQSVIVAAQPDRALVPTGEAPLRLDLP